MIKILILSAIVILSALLGTYLSADKKKRMKVFAELYDFNERLILNMQSERRSVGEVAKDFHIVQDIIEDKKVLDGEDAEFISEYVHSLGKSDARSQIDYLKEKQSLLRKYKDESQTNYKKYGSLYLKLSIMVGILVAVLLA